MKEIHIIPLLDSNQFRSLSGPDTLQLEAHIAHCDDCRRAYLAAQATSSLLQARAAEVTGPPPFFATRVMASIREQQNAPAWFDLVTMWKVARSLLLSAVSVVVLLAGLTFLVPQPNPAAQPPFWQTSTEGVVFGDEVSRLNETSNDQVMDVVFAPEEDDASDQK